MKARELTERLLDRGFFPDHLTPPFTSDGLSGAYGDILRYVRPLRRTTRKKLGSYPRAKTVRHSVPKRRLSRRFLAVPNPLHHVLVSRVIASHWSDLKGFCARSKISLSRPVVGSERAIESETPKRSETRERALRSIGKKFLLKADLARFYPSIYTHSVPWALHGKDAARNDNNLYGNRIDERVRESQDKQTGGIPIGPDTSYLIAEVVGTAIDVAIEKRVGSLNGTRYIDDYHLYFDSYNDAEEALEALHEAAASLELEVNDLKTEIVPTPEALEPDWKTELRARTLGSTSEQQAQLVDLFSRAAALAFQHPHDNVLTFVAKMVEGFDVAPGHWPLCEALLLRSVVAEPKILKVILDIYEANHLTPDLGMVQQAIEAICLEHGRLQHGNEILWALWAARTLDIHLDAEIAQVISAVDDDLVALTALHLEDVGLITGLNKAFWQQFMSKDHLYSNHWLLAYEASVKGWLAPPKGRDFTAVDDFFKILRTHDVSFYDDSDSEYTDDDSQGDGEETDAGEADEEVEIEIGGIDQLRGPLPF
jgi:reverse transcriptase-like protein